MKILHIGKFLPPVKGGMENSIFTICKGLSAQSQIQAVLVGVDPEGKAYTKIEDSGLTLKALKNWRTVASTPFVTGLRKVLREQNPDLVHVHLPNPWMTILLQQWSGPLVATYHCDVINYPLLVKMYSPVLHHFLGRCQKIVATSPQLIASSSVLKTFEKKVKIIPLSIPPLSTRTSSSGLLEKLKAQSSDRIILFVGRLVSYKGLEFLIDSMKSVNGHLVIVGDGPEREKLVRQIQHLGLQDKITFAGAVSDEELPEFYKAARIVALSSINESEALGICLIEALSMGRPLVTTDLPTGVSFVNQNEVTGLRVPVKDSQALAQALSHILENPDVWNQFSKNALQHYQKNFNLNEIIHQHVSMYKEVMSS